MILRLNEDRDIPNNNQRISRFTRTARQNVSQRDKELFARKLVELARVTQPYVERANRIIDKFGELYQAGIIPGDELSVSGNGRYEEIVLIMDHDEVTMLIYPGGLSMGDNGGNFTYLSGGEDGAELECHLSTDYNAMLNQLDEWYWDDYSQRDKTQLFGHINTDIEQSSDLLERLLAVADRELDYIRNNEEGEF